MNLDNASMSPSKSSSKDLPGTDGALLRALLIAENKFGSTSGEVGLVLMSMVDQFKDDPGQAENVAVYTKRIEEILAFYLEDQDIGCI